MSLAITLGLLIIYDLLIRYTFIGAMLNGRKTRPPLFARSPAPAAPSASRSAASPPTAPSASPYPAVPQFSSAPGGSTLHK